MPPGAKPVLNCLSSAGRAASTHRRPSRNACSGGPPGEEHVKRRIDFMDGGRARGHLRCRSLLSGGAGAAIAPPWCGTPIPDATAALPDGTGPTHPWGAIRTFRGTRSAARSTTSRRAEQRTDEPSRSAANPRSATTCTRSRSMRSTRTQRRDSTLEEDPPQCARATGARSGSSCSGHDVKVPIFIPGGIHGNESEGIDADMMLIERLATTPYGTDPSWTTSSTTRS